ncbi:hypothetical protein [Streptomyces sp. NPDC058657]|uniref:hypothetical protein n=1 Tax=unclassified Streptomyces TaxID=2593676 RepID=UPI0036644576
MKLLLLLVLAVLLGLGFLNSLWWVAAAVLVFGLLRYGRNERHHRRGSYRDYEEYRDHRNREDHWGRRYARERRYGRPRHDRERQA